MMCYRDRSFCNQLECANTICTLRFTAKDKKKSEEAGLPISFVDYKDDEVYCIGYKNPDEEENSYDNRNNTTDTKQ
jgi:hypothetical protein